MKETIMSKITDEQFARFVKESFSIKEVCTKCGYSNVSGASSNIVKLRIADQQLSTTHFKVSEKTNYMDEDIFVEDSPVGQATLRRRYVRGNYSEYKCSICGQEPFWNGKELTLTLDHINGHNRDDRLENLRWVCPNCDRQLDTFGGRNIIRTESQKNYCIDCGAEIIQSSIRCPSCSAKMNGLARRKADRPDRDTLKGLIRQKPFTKIGEDFGVTDNAIRKWCDEYKLPRTKKEIAKYSEQEWVYI